MKKMNLEGNDLLIERDAGNPVLILMGKEEYAMENWGKLQDLCDEAMLKLSADRVRNNIAYPRSNP